jgi:exodeoxyribonuclease VII small subunit
MGKKKSAAEETETPAESFEQSLAKLEEVVAKLESGRLPLAEALSAYETGVGRLRRCYELLERAELKIAEVSRVDEQGRPQLASYRDGGGSGPQDLADKADARSRRRSALTPPARGVEDADDGALF